jgi:hypothetical protein
MTAGKKFVSFPNILYVMSKKQEVIADALKAIEKQFGK